MLRWPLVTFKQMKQSQPLPKGLGVSEWREGHLCRLAGPPARDSLSGSAHSEDAPQASEEASPGGWAWLSSGCSRLCSRCLPRA